MILVTGGTGLVGAHLLFHLASLGQNIKAIYRNTARIEKTKHVFSYYSNNVEPLFNAIEWVKADINNIPELETAFNNVTQVYHCAALISFDPKHYFKLRKINIEGTANIVNLCLSKKVEKLCYVSSIAAIGHTLNEQKITENTEWNPEFDNTVYGISKYGAELEVWRGTQEGLNAVIVNPGLVLGPGFWGSGSGFYFSKIANHLPYYVKGVTGYIDVKDVVNCMLELMRSNITNERYILISENWDFKTFANHVAKCGLVKPPTIKLTKPILEIAWRLDWFKQKLTGSARQLTKQTAQSALSQTTYDNLKIKKAINYRFIPITESIESTCRYYLQDIKQ